MRSDAQARPQEGDAPAGTTVSEGAVAETAAAEGTVSGTAVSDGPVSDGPVSGVAGGEPAPGGRRAARRKARDGGTDVPDRGRITLPLVPVLAGLLVLLLAGLAFLWLTRPEPSAVRTDDYVDALQAARSGIVDLTSFDHLTLDDDIEQVRRVATGDLRDESIAQLDESRQQLTQTEAVVNTEVVGGGVTKADDSAATALLLIQSTQQSNAGEQAQVVRYRIQVELEKVGDRWMLSGITGR